jgi:hypothetical protein
MPAAAWNNAGVSTVKPACAWPLPRTTFPLAAVLLLAAAFAACDQVPTAPSDGNGLLLTAAVNPTVIERGQTGTLTLSLQNQTSRDIELSFGSSCQVMPYIAVRGTGEIVYPTGGGWVCLTVMTGLTVPAGGSVTRVTELIAAETAPHPYAALPPGEYAAYARIDSTTHKLQSEPAYFRVN